MSDTVIITIPRAWFRRMLTTYLESRDGANGGWLHIAVEDGNLDEDDIQWCLDEATKDGDGAAVVLASMLLGITPDARARLIGGGAVDRCDACQAIMKGADVIDEHTCVDASVPQSGEES
jgi:hypothetical protein